jgi:hypothetical protein
MAQPGERLVPTSHYTLQTRLAEVVKYWSLDTQIDLLVCILGPLSHSDREKLEQKTRA